VLARVEHINESPMETNGVAQKCRNDWLIWQLADSAFPTGGFAHSGGLEAAWQHGELRNREELKSFVEASLWQFGKGALPFMLAAYDDPSGLLELDELCDCFTANHVANRASRLQGQALLASAERIFAVAALREIRSRASFEQPFHLSPVFGIVMNVLEIERRPAAELFFFSHLRSLTASAVRLGIVGPMEAQSLQHQSALKAIQILNDCEDLAVEDAAQTAPLLDIWQGAQDRLYSRLFQS
jgi:urease accessory protein